MRAAALLAAVRIVAVVPVTPSRNLRRRYSYHRDVVALCGFLRVTGHQNPGIVRDLTYRALACGQTGNQVHVALARLVLMCQLFGHQRFINPRRQAVFLRYSIQKVAQRDICPVPVLL